MKDPSAVQASDAKVQIAIKAEVAKLSGALVGALILLILAAGLWVQSYTFLNLDVAWVLYSSNKLLDGAQLGRDVIAANPPLIWWLSLIPNLLANATGMSQIDAFRGLVFVGSAASIFYFRKFALPAGRLNWKQASLLAALAWLVAFAVHREFGQREHIAVLLTMPYFAALIGRLSGRSPMFPQGLAIGIAAGVGVALKPQFIFAPLFVEAFVLWRLRSPALLVRAEAIGGVLAVVCYAIALPLFAPVWFFETAAEIYRVYWGFEVRVPWLFLLQLFFLPTALFVWARKEQQSDGSDILVLAALGFFVAAILQGKFYNYHLYPAYALLVLAGLTAVLWKSEAPSLVAKVLAATVLLNSAVISHTVLRGLTPSGEAGRAVAQVAQFVAETVPEGGSFISISTHPFPGFPTTLYANRTWGSATNSRIYLPAVVKLRRGDVPADPDLLQFAEAKAHAGLLRDLRLRPYLILIDEHPIQHAIGPSTFDHLKFFREHKEIDELMRSYRRLETAPAGYGAYVLDIAPQGERS